MPDTNTTGSEQNRATNTLHGVESLISDGADDRDIIVHVDCDCFYAACEQQRRPVLRGEPVIVGMGYDPDKNPSGAVATASYEAREYGIESAMRIEDAVELLPPSPVLPSAGTETWSETVLNHSPDDAGFYCPVDMDFYEEVGESVRDILGKYTTTLEPISIDEAYLELPAETRWDTVEHLMMELKNEIRRDIGVPVSVGVAPTKSAAKVASDYEKPNGLVVVQPGDVTEFFAPLPVDLVHGIGPVATEKLQDIGIENGEDLATTDPHTLRELLGTQGVEAHQRVRGHDPREVTEPDDPKSISNETSLGTETTNMEVKTNIIDRLLDKVYNRVKDKGVLYQTISLKIVEPPFNVSTRARSLPGPISDKETTRKVLHSLLSEFETDPVRKIGVRVSKLSFTDTEQPTLDFWESKGRMPGEYAKQQSNQYSPLQKQSQKHKDRHKDTSTVESEGNSNQSRLSDF